MNVRGSKFAARTVAELDAESFAPGDLDIAKASRGRRGPRLPQRTGCLLRPGCAARKPKRSRCSRRRWRPDVLARLPREAAKIASVPASATPSFSRISSRYSPGAMSTVSPGLALAKRGRKSGAPRARLDAESVAAPGAAARDVEGRQVQKIFRPERQRHAGQHPQDRPSRQGLGDFALLPAVRRCAAAPWRRASLRTRAAIRLAPPAGLIPNCGPCTNTAVTLSLPSSAARRTSSRTMAGAVPALFIDDAADLGARQGIAQPVAAEQESRCGIEREGG